MLLDDHTRNWVISVFPIFRVQSDPDAHKFKLGENIPIAKVNVSYHFHDGSIRTTALQFEATNDYASVSFALLMEKIG